MPFQPTLPTWLAINACNDTSASGQTDLRTLQPVNAGGLNLGDYFDLTEAEAILNSDTAIGKLHSGRYRRVQVDSGATASNVKTGTIGLLSSLAEPPELTAPGGLSMNVVTSYDQGQGSAVTLRPVVFLNVVTPGNFCFVQELGVATVLGKATSFTGAAAIGVIIGSTTSGLVDVPTSTTAVTTTSVGIALDQPLAGKLFRIIMQYVPVVQD